MPIIIPSSCQVYDFHHSSICLNNGIMYGQYKQDLVIDIYVAKEMVKDGHSVSRRISRPFLLDITGLLCVDADGRSYLAGAEAGAFVSAGAIYTKNKLLAFVANAYIFLCKPLMPAKVFSNEPAAVRWLEPYKFPN